MWDLWNMAFHRSLVFQVMPTFKSGLSNKGLFSEEDLNKALKGVLTNKLSFRKASKVYRIPIGTLHRYKMVCAVIRLAQMVGAFTQPGP